MKALIKIKRAVINYMNTDEPNRFLLFFLIYLSVSVPFTSLSMEIPMIHMGTDQGLPSNTIYDLFQDRDGFIWLGTDKGVSRFNGMKFENFTTNDGLADNECFYFVPDLNGRLWIGMFNGELCYYKDGIFHSAVNTPFLKLPHKASHTVEIKLYKDSSITFFFKDDPGFYTITGEKIQYFLLPFMVEKFKNNHNRYISKIADSTYQIVYNRETVTINLKSNYISSVDHSKLNIDTYVFSRDIDFFIGSDNTLYDSRLKKIMLNNNSVPNNLVVHQIYFYENQEFLATNKGIIVNGIDTILSGYDINSILKDKDGNFWIGTAQDGIFKMSSNFLAQKQIPIDTDKPVVFAERKGHFVFYATKDRNVFRVDLQNSCRKMIFDANVLSDADRSLKSTYWITKDILFNISGKENYRILNASGDNPIPEQAHLGNLWGSHKNYQAGDLMFFISSNGLFYYQTKMLYLKTGKIDQKMVVFDQRKNIYGSGLDNKGNLWFSTISDVFKMNDTVPEWQKMIKGYAFKDFMFIGEKIIGITHHNHLLISNSLISPVFDTIKNPGCIWEKLYKVNDSSIFISTDNFLRYISFSRHSELPKYAISILVDPILPYQPEILYVDSSNCYFIKRGHLSIFPIHYVTRKLKLPVLRITQIKTQYFTYLAIFDTLKLDYKEAQNLKIGFTSVSFEQPASGYEYSVSSNAEGQIWHSIKGEEINLIHNSYGLVTVMLRAITMSGEYSVPKIIYLSINKPYWLRWWFLLLCFLIIGASLALILRLLNKKAIADNNAEIRFLKSEYKSLNALMNPHFIFNSLNSVQGLVNSRELISASKYIRIFSDLIRQNMVNIGQDLITLEQELILVENYIKIEQLRLNGRLSYKIQLDDVIEPEFIKIPPLLIQPLVENAIKHGIWPDESGQQGMVTINISQDTDCLKIVVEDNGIGFSKAKNTATINGSYALTNINKRIEQLVKMYNLKIKLLVQEVYDHDGHLIGVESVVTIKSQFRG